MEKSACCKPTEHDYACSVITFSRDEEGVAFIGFGKNNAAQFQTWVCRKCGGAVEVEVRPALVQREIPDDLKNRFNKKGNERQIPREAAVAAKA